MIDSTATPQPRLSKNEALARVRQLKRWVVGGSLATFLTVGGLISAHTFGWSLSSILSSDQQTQQDQNGSFFNQGSQTNSGGSNVGTSNGSQPVTSTSSS
jgi:hypothetical protein